MVRKMELRPRICRPAEDLRPDVHRSAARAAVDGPYMPCPEILKRVLKSSVPETVNAQWIDCERGFRFVAFGV